MKPTALMVLTAFALTPALAPAMADVPPPPAPLPAEIDTTAASTAASIFAPGTAWDLSLAREGDTYTGDLVIQPGNRFTLSVKRVNEPGRSKDGGGVWGIISAGPDGGFTVAFVVLEVEEDGEYDADEALVFRLKAESEGVLKGEMIDGREAAPMTLTRR